MRRPLCFMDWERRITARRASSPRGRPVTAVVPVHQSSTRFVDCSNVASLCARDGVIWRQGCRDSGSLEHATTKLSGALRLLLAQLKMELDQLVIRGGGYAD